MSSSDLPTPIKKAPTGLEAWGLSSMPAMGLATLITALHWRPFQPLPMLFVPVLLGSSYLNVAGFQIDSAGITAAWSGLYVLLAMRRRQPLKRRFMARGIVRGAAMGLGTANAVACGYTYAKGDRKQEAVERKARNRWGTEN